jgi:putative DNA primase/helicase
LVWDGARWKIDETGEVHRRAKETVVRWYEEARGEVERLRELRDNLPKKDRNRGVLDQEFQEAEAELRHAHKSQSLGRLEAMLTLAQSEPGIPVLPEDLDKDPWLFNVQNGTINLRTGDCRPHRRGDLLTKLAPVNYDQEALCPTWDRFLDRIMAGNKDLIDFLRRAAGYSLTGSVREQCLFFLYGSGANGKSTFLSTVQALVGDYGIQSHSELLMARTREVHPTERSDLYRKRLVSCVEVDQGRRMAESLVKQLTGGEKVRARRMREDFWEFDPTHKLFLAGNHKPTVQGTDEGIWRRVLLVPFTVSIPEAERDKDLPDKLKAELPGILNWFLRGCREWRSSGLGIPDEVRKATAQYRDEMDDFEDFLDDCCVVRENLRIRTSVLHRAYRKWVPVGRTGLSRDDLKARLINRGFQVRRTGKDGSDEYQGLSLRDDNR